MATGSPGASAPSNASWCQTRLTLPSAASRSSPPSSATVAEFAGERLRRIWHHDAFDGVLVVGAPVAVHDVYGVLAHGGRRFSVATA